MASQIDYEWVIEKLEAYLGHLNSAIALGSISTTTRPTPHSQKAGRELDEELSWLRRHQVQALRIMAKAYAEGITLPQVERNNLRTHRSLVEAAIGAISTSAETDAHMPSGPSIDINPDELHPWVWEPAKSFWNSKHWGAAVQQAATSVNLHIQQLVDRNEISDKDLMLQALNLKDPDGKTPMRLRVHPSDGSKTYVSTQEGAMYFGAGLFAMLRNIEAHQLEGNTPPEEAIEALAALSLFARRVEGAAIVQYEPGEGDS